VIFINQEVSIMKLPKSVEITDVGPRDGFQNIKTFIPTETKVRIIGELISSGLKRIELTSFVHPKAVPQMADSAEVLTTVKQQSGGQIRCIALVPNLFGAKRAIELGADEITFVISASEQHNMENTKQTVDQSLAAFKEVCGIKGKVSVRLAIATAFTCPFAGIVSPDKVIRIIEAGKAAGADDFMLADTLGTANPAQVEGLLELLLPKYGNQFVLHIHDTYGMGLANVLTSLNMGMTRFEASIGGLGGCPFAPGAAGNIATEDLVNMLHMMNISTGIDLDRLVKTAQMAAAAIDASFSGHIMHNTGKCNLS
jgi:hydroxymethylglutaryl-CoA lyase